MRARENKPARRLTAADCLAISLGLAALVAGIALLALTNGTVVLIVAAGFFGLATVAFVALLFLLVGESEDRHYRKGSL
ncbi:MAG: hypothetical protein ACRDK2_12295 [Solirubrobacteraceae bacterium]